MSTCSSVRLLAASGMKKKNQFILQSQCNYRLWSITLRWLYSDDCFYVWATSCSLCLRAHCTSSECRLAENTFVCALLFLMSACQNQFPSLALHLDCMQTRVEWIRGHNVDWQPVRKFRGCKQAAASSYGRWVTGLKHTSRWQCYPNRATLP